MRHNTVAKLAMVQSGFINFQPHAYKYSQMFCQLFIIQEHYFNLTTVAIHFPLGHLTYKTLTCNEHIFCDACLQTEEKYFKHLL